MSSDQVDYKILYRHPPVYGTFIPLHIIDTTGEERHKLGKIKDERYTILGKDNIVKIVYPNTCQQNHEADYLMRLRDIAGVPWLHKECDMCNIIEQVYPLPSGNYEYWVIYIIMYKVCNLIETLYRNDIVHTRIRYFIYFVDNVNYKCTKRADVKYDLLQMVDLAQSHSDIPFTLCDDILQIVHSQLDIYDMFRQIRSRCCRDY